MSKSEPKRPADLPEPPSKKPDKSNSSNLFWFLMILAVVGAILFGFSAKWRGKTLTYSEFVNRLEDHTLHAENVLAQSRFRTSQNTWRMPNEVLNNIPFPLAA